MRKYFSLLMVFLSLHNYPAPIFSQWEVTPDSIQNIVPLFVKGERIYAGTLGAIYYSLDRGENWELTGQGLQSWSSVVALDANDFLVMAGCSGDGIYILPADSSSWIHRSTGIHSTNVASVLACDTLLFVGTTPDPMTGESGGLYKSTLDNYLWEKIEEVTANYIMALAKMGELIFAGTESGVFRSQDNGISWKLVLQDGTANSIGVNGTNVFVGTCKGGIYKSADGGETWAFHNSGLPDGCFVSIAFENTHIFAAEKGVFMSNNGGNNWYSISEGLPDKHPNNFVASTIIAEGYLFASLRGGLVWRRSISEILSVEDRFEELPSTLILQQNYPNPFNPETIIKYQNAKPEYITLSVFNARGQLLRILINEHKSAGTFTVSWDGKDKNGHQLPSGVYFYQIIAGDFSDTKKLLLIR